MPGALCLVRCLAPYAPHAPRALHAPEIVFGNRGGVVRRSATVPAQAELVPVNGKMKFADKAFEGKPYFWKQCYRAGKPSVDAAREAAEAWLKSIQ